MVSSLVTEPNKTLFVDWSPYLGHVWTQSAETGMDIHELQSLAHDTNVPPDNFPLQRQVGKILEDRRKMAAGAMPMNWGFAETLAYASLLKQGYPVRLTGHGPDMDQVEALVKSDPNIKGIWCVPKYSNPTGCVYSDQVVDEMAALPDVAAADDFIVLWDNAYAAHDFNLPGRELKSIFAAAQAASTADHVVQFASTSKITFAGGGVAFVASSERVLKALEERLSFMMIGPDKVNQLRHARFLGGRLEQHMQAHAALLKPKFDAVEETLSKELGDLDIAQWTQPGGGYFVSLDVKPGLAHAIVSMAKEVGLTLTPAGATYPYGQDPDDSNIRIAPSFASLEELRTAMQILTLCVKLASVREQIKTLP